jgi:hypothetical protein
MASFLFANEHCFYGTKGHHVVLSSFVGENFAMGRIHHSFFSWEHVFIVWEGLKGNGIIGIHYNCCYRYQVSTHQSVLESLAKNANKICHSLQYPD